MDLTGLGLTRPNKLLKQIEAHNTILLKLNAHVAKLNAFTNTFLTKTTPGLMAASDTSVNFDNLQQAFQELYYAYNADTASSNRKTGPSLKELQVFRKDLDPSSSDELSLSLVNFINYYSVIAATKELSNRLIYNTVLDYQQLQYWQSLSQSTLAKVIFAVQMSPLKLYSFGQSLLNTSVARADSAGEFDVSYLETRATLEEDNWWYRKYYYYKRMATVVLNTFANMVRDLVVDANPILFVTTKKTKLMSWTEFMTSNIKKVYRFPSKLVNQEIEQNIARINQEIEISHARIGKLINNLPVSQKALQTLEFTKSDNDLFNVRILQQIAQCQGGNNVSERVDILINTLAEHRQHEFVASPPPFVVRWWPVLFLLVQYGPGLTFSAVNQRQEIVHWVKHNLVDTIVGFWVNWVVSPISNMLGVLRNDEVNELSITSKESLKSDLDSLERMVVDYVIDYEGNNTDKGELTKQIHQSVSNGDLTALMSNYEKDLKQPFKSIVKGSLVRALLIQIQKTKVDGAVAISGIDKLLKSQQLVFGVVSISPSLLILYKLYQYFLLSQGKNIVVNGKELRFVCLKSLNTVERLLSEPENDATKGRLFVEMINLIINSKKIIPKQLIGDWINDLNELNDIDTSKDQKLTAVNRIWNMYGSYFR